MHRRRLGLFGGLVLSWFGVSASWAMTQFVDESATRGILTYSQAPGMGGGVVAADYDDDGDIDLFVPNAEAIPDQLYRNDGGTFVEIAASVGLASVARSRAALWFDYDGDGQLDLVVAGDCHSLDPSCPATSTVRLYRQVSSTEFQDVTAVAGLAIDRVVDTSAHRGALAAGDLNNDGYLDLILSLWMGEATVYLNNGDGTFSDISVASGIGGMSIGHWQPVLYDFDQDGRIDVFFAIDFDANRLWMNDGDNTFSDVATAAGVDYPYNDMGVSLGDFDGDWDLDVFVTNVTSADETIHSVLYRNDSVGSPVFAEVAKSCGVHDISWGWGATFFDCDNDGKIDLAATNGFMAGWSTDTSRFFLNTGGDPVFVDESAATGFNDSYWGSALIAIDLDRDGFLDMVQTTNAVDAEPSRLRVLRNQPDAPALSNHYLVVRPRMTGSNHRAIGAVVRAEVGALHLIRPITAGTSFLGQEPAEAFLGLGAATVVDRLLIDWPDGSQTEQLNVPADQVLTVTIDPDTDGDGTADPVDTDDDGDGVPDGADCSPTGAQAWALPNGASGLQLTHATGQTTLSWNAPADPGGSLVYYDTVVSAAPDDFSAAATCLERNGSDRETMEPGVPALGEVLNYVVRPGNVCGHGSSGQDSFGTLRTVVGCP